MFNYDLLKWILDSLTFVLLDWEQLRRQVIEY